MTTKVVISYSKADSSRWRGEIRTHFDPYIRSGRLELWDDSKIVPGASWDPAIRAAFESASAAIILLSPEYLATDYVDSYEIPFLQKAHDSGLVQIYVVFVKSVALEEGHFFLSLQAINPPDQPLEGKNTESDPGEVLTRLVDAVVDYFNLTQKRTPEPDFGVQNRVPRFPCNLPRQDIFVGRRKEKADLIKFLSPDFRSHIVAVDGIGGLGKTALVLAVAYACLDASTSRKDSASAPQFGAIIYTSAKSKQLLPDGEFPVSPRQSTLKDIYQSIATTLDDQGINQTTPDEQMNRVYQGLKRQNTLLIVDNFEEVIDRRPVLEFLANLPSPTKAIITSRVRIVDWAVIHLDSLPQRESLRLLRNQAKQKGLSLGQDEALEIYRRFGGVPLALIFAVGQMASGFTLKWVLDQSVRCQQNGRPSLIASYCFATSVNSLNRTPAHKLLMAIAMFRHAPTRDAVICVAGIRDRSQGIAEIDEGFEKLVRLSLVRSERGRFRMLPIIKEYTLGELEENLDFRDMARERWIRWHRSLAKRNGGKDWGEWHVKYDRIDDEWGNLLSALDWCAAEKRYELVKELWGFLNDFASLNGYWEDRLFWTGWLIEEARTLGDYPTIVKAMSNRSWTLTQIGEPREIKEAETILMEAWSTVKIGVGEPKAQLALMDGLAKHTAYLCISKEDYDAARSWLAKERVYLNKLRQISGGESERWTRSRINISYYLGEIDFLAGDHGRARKRFDGILKRALRIDWTRRASYARHWLAEIAISEGRYETAAELLKEGLRTATENKEKRRIAVFHLSFSRLERARNNTEKAEEWGRSAADLFKRLGMGKDAPHVKHWLDS